METHPTYAPPKKSNTGLIIGLVLGGIAICCIGGVALGGFGLFSLFKNTIAPMAECVMNYQAVSESLEDYANAHNGKLPSAAAWQDEMAPYVEKRLAKVKKSDAPFKVMDPKGEWSCTFGDKKTGLAFNSELEGKTLAEASKDDKIVLFEVEQISRNLAQKYIARDKSTSPKIIGGDRRGWITIRAAGGLHMGNESMRSHNGDFNFNSHE